MPLKVSHGIGAWIKDFKGSDAPQFKGKSDNERRDQAIAAYLSAKRDQKEGKESPPFDGPYKKVKSVVPGKHGEGPSTAKHLAKLGMKLAQDKKKPVKESDAAWAAAKEKEKMDRLNPNDQDKIAKIRAMLAKEKKPVKEGTGSLKPGWMLKKDPELAKKIKDKVDLAKKRQATYGDKSAGKSVGEAKERTSTYRFTHTPGDAESEKKLADLKKHVKDNMPGHRVVLQGRLGKNNPNAHKYSKSAPAAKYDAKGKRTNADVSGKSSGYTHTRIQKADAAKHDVYVYRREDVEYMQEETTFEVEVEGLPTMYMKAKSPGAVKAELRKVVKQPSMIQSVERVTDAEMKKVFRDKSQGREEEEMDEGVQQTLRKYVPGYAKHQLNKKMDAQAYEKGDSIKKTVDKDTNYYRYKKLADKLKKEEVEIDEAKTPSDAELHKTLGPSKNMQQGVEALKKKHGMTDAQAKAHIKRLMGESVNEVSGALAQRYHDKAMTSKPSTAGKKDPIGHSLKRFSGMQRAQDRIHRDSLKDIDKRASDRLKGM